QYIWQFQYFNASDLRTVQGDKLRVIFPGRSNRNQGPDFADARIEIGNTLMAGSVELHTRTSQWSVHGHDGDGNYANVILHVVYEQDKALPGSLPLLELRSRVSRILLERYRRLMENPVFIPCSGSLVDVKDLVALAWKERLVAERLARRSAAAEAVLQQTKAHWEQTFWQLLARNFGIRVNMDAFEAVARSIPFSLLSRHRGQVHQLEALLLGQAGLLEKNFSESYPLLLQREYAFLKRKYGLHPIPLPLHFLRMRPGNFPTVRLAQLAAVLQQSDRLFARVLEAESAGELRSLLMVTANDYWHYHYRLDEPSVFRKKAVGKEMADNIIINTAIPLLFAYGSRKQDEKLCQKALDWLHRLPAETNATVRGFAGLGLSSVSAFDSQAFLELKTRYCDHKRCLSCMIGNHLLKRDYSTDRLLL
ncbi:MAG TPA: DUF2851 family protein, partial [Flavisolibacter sp.]|nr:DUF2851 family protein [Flavisolibacter sp.]